MKVLKVEITTTSEEMARDTAIRLNGETGFLEAYIAQELARAMMEQKVVKITHTKDEYMRLHRFTAEVTVL